MHEELSGVWIMAYTTIDDPSAYFQTALYTGNNSNRSITNDGNSDLQPDWIWGKSRSNADAHTSTDSSRGNTKVLTPNATEAEGTASDYVTAFDSDGFSLGTNNGMNKNTLTYVAWQWKANGGTTSTNTSGTNIDSTVQANTTAGFSIITYTGTGTDNDSIGHGLGAVPAWFIIKRRSGTEDWAVYHHKNTSAPETDHLLLNTQDATSDSDTRFSDQAPSSTVITLGNNAVVNANSSTYVCYAFAEIQGYSKFGVYTGNGNADGPFVYTGFKPAFFIVKRTDASGENFVLRDNAVSPINPVNAYVVANDNRAEANHYAVDLLSNGFKVRTSESGHNHDGGTYIYMAFAENPFVSSKGAPTTAR